MTKSAAKKWDIFNSKFILREKRYVWLDYDKGISIILVAYGHAYFMLADHGVDMSSYPYINYVGTFLWGFRMPLFFIVSGTLISRSLEKRGLLAYLVNRANNILYPLIVWGVLSIILSWLNNRDQSIATDSLANLFIEPRLMGHLWYLNALFFIGVIYSVIKAKLKLKPYMQLILGAVLFSVAGYIQINDINAGMLTDVCEFYFFFALGDVISKTFFNEQFVKRFTSWKIFFPLFIAFIIIQYICAEYNLNGGADGINFVQHKLPWLYIGEALIGCAVSISFSFLLQKYRVFSFLRVVGYHSLFIYCMQIILMNFLRIGLSSILHITYVPLLFMSIWLLGTFIPILIYNILLKINMWWLFTFKKPMEHYNFVQQAELQ